MIPSPRRRAGGGLLALVLGTAVLAGCTDAAPASPVQPRPRTTAPTTAAPAPVRSSLSPLPVPTAPIPRSLPASPTVRLAPVKSSPNDLARVEIRGGSPRSRSATTTLPNADGFTVTAGCVGVAGSLIHWAVVARHGDGFLFGSSAPCNGAFLTDAGLVEVDAPTAARLEVTTDAGVSEATVVLRRAAG